MDSRKTPEIFEHGSVWARADFHLHTIKDKEFNYQDAEGQRSGPVWLDSMVHSLGGASRWSDYAAVSRVVRLSQYTCSGVLPSSALCGLCWL